MRHTIPRNSIILTCPENWQGVISFFHSGTSRQRIKTRQNPILSKTDMAQGSKQRQISYLTPCSKSLVNRSIKSLFSAQTLGLQKLLSKISVSAFHFPYNIIYGILIFFRCMKSNKQLKKFIVHQGSQYPSSSVYVHASLPSQLGRTNFSQLFKWFASTDILFTVQVSSEAALNFRILCVHYRGCCGNNYTLKLKCQFHYRLPFLFLVVASNQLIMPSVWDMPSQLILFWSFAHHPPEHP